MIKIREIDKHYFSSIAEIVNSQSYNKSECKSMDVITLDIASENSSDLSVRSSLQSKGYCVVQTAEPSQDYRLQYEKYLAALFGEPMSGKNTSYQPYTKVQATENAKFYVNSNVAQPIHTDEGHTTVFPRYAALYCEKEAFGGGESIIVPFSLLYSELVQNFGKDVYLLFAKDAITIENYQGVKQKPILINFENGDIGVSYSPVLQKMWCSDRVFEMFDYITQFAHTVDNQIRFKLISGQALIFDNCRILHGRTSFFSNEPRLLYRYWFQQVSL
jgi:hypothetical protein